MSRIPGTPQKPRAAQGELRNLRHEAREKLHALFREEKGTLPLKEIARRLLEEFDVRAGMTALSDYYSQNYHEIYRVSAKDAIEVPKTIVIRIEVPPGCRINVATEPEEGPAE